MLFHSPLVFIIFVLNCAILQECHGQIQLSLDTTSFNLNPLKEILKSGVPSLAGRSAKLMQLLSQQPSSLLVTHSPLDNPSTTPRLVSPSLTNWTCSQPVPYDTLMLALQWSPGLCHQQENYCLKDKVVDSFTIHGLWPTTLDNLGDDRDFSNVKLTKREKKQRKKSPSFCCNHESFNMTDAALAVKSDLSKIWPTLLQKKSLTQFLSHEWKKHGSCAYVSSPHIQSHSDYFSTTEKLFNRTKINEWFKRDSITPTSKYSYSVDEIHSSISRRTNKNIIVQCRSPSKKSDFHQKHSLLKEIRVCFHPLTLAFKDCHTEKNRSLNCRNNRVMILPKM